MGGPTFNFGSERPSAPLPTNQNSNETGSWGVGARAARNRYAFTSPRRGSLPELAHRTIGGPWKRLGIRGKVAFVAMFVLIAHLLSVNVFFPYITHHTVGSAPVSSSITDGSKHRDAGGNAGGIIRLLTETWSSGSAETLVSVDTQRAAMVAKYGDKASRGRDIWIKRDHLTNPFILPPRDIASASDPANVRRYKARTLNKLFREKCKNMTVVPYQGGLGDEWVTTSRAYQRMQRGRVSKFRWCRGGNDAEVPDLQQVLMRHSNKSRPERAVTIVTQLSLERASMLEQQCSLWPHTIAAVVYIPLLRGKIYSAEDTGGWHLSPLERGIEEMQALFEKMESLPAACVLDIEVVAEERCDKSLASMYPTNSVRNRALHLAFSDVVLLLDVDFVVDVSLAKSFEDASQYKELIRTLEQHKALVLPAFEAWDQGDWGRKIALDAVVKGKQYITQKFMYNVVIGFHMSHYAPGHEKTNFWRWINSTEAYEIEYQIGFEPYILMLKKYVPYYDERFRGYYWNKVQHLLHIALQNSFKFVIHPRSFVVHVPHRKPATKWRTKKSGQKERNHEMFLEAVDDMKQDRFAPVTSFPHLCLPPQWQLAAAEAISNPEQKTGLLEMAPIVAPLPEGEPKGGGFEALLRARGKFSNENGKLPDAGLAIDLSTLEPRIASVNQVDGDGKQDDEYDGSKGDQQSVVEAGAEKEQDDGDGGIGGGELSTHQERPVLHEAMKEFKKAQQQEQVLANEDLKQDLEDLREAEAASATAAVITSEEEEAEVMAEAKESAALVAKVDDIIRGRLPEY